MNDKAAELLALFQRAAQPTLAEIKRAQSNAPDELAYVFQPIKEHLFEPAYDHAALRRDVAAALRKPSGGKGRRKSRSRRPLAQADELLALFRREIGLAPHLYMLEGRMEVTARLLADTKLFVADVGDLVGYPDTAAFRRAVNRWTGGLSPGVLRDRLVAIKARVGPLPEGVLSWSYWHRMRRGELSDREVRELLAYLEALYEVPAERAPMDAGTVRHAGLRRRLAAELARRLAALPWDDQRRLVRRSLRFGTPELFERLCHESRAAGRRDRRRAVELMELAIVALEARAELRGVDDAPRLRRGWSRLAWTCHRAGDAVRADQALGFAALERERAGAEERDPPGSAECLTLEADVRWGQGRDDMALALLDRALALLDGDTPEAGELRGRALLLRAGVRLYAPRPTRAGAGQARDDLVCARDLFGEAHGSPELAELHDLWLRLHVMLGDTEEVRRALVAAREHGDPRLLARCEWYEGVIARKADPVRAERCLRDARAALVDLGLPEQAAPASLELVTLHLWRGQLVAAEENAGPLVDVLADAARTPERLAALKALRQALRAKNLTPEVLQVVRHAVADLEREAKAKSPLTP